MLPSSSVSRTSESACTVLPISATSDVALQKACMAEGTGKKSGISPTRRGAAPDTSNCAMRSRKPPCCESMPT